MELERTAEMDAFVEMARTHPASEDSLCTARHDASNRARRKRMERTRREIIRAHGMKREAV